MGVEVTADNTGRFLSEMAAAKARALEKIGLVAEGYAKGLCPVDTGRLRNSVTHVTGDDAVAIGTNVEYGPYVEMGTGTRRAKPFLRPAAHDHGPLYRQILKREMGEG